MTTNIKTINKMVEKLRALGPQFSHINATNINSITLPIRSDKQNRMVQCKLSDWSRCREPWLVVDEDGNVFASLDDKYLISNAIIN